MPEEPKQNKRDIIVDFGSDAAGAGGKSWFFGIGINTYTHFPPLNNAVKDVQDLVKLLQAEYSLTAEHTLTLYNEKATRKNVITMLDRLQTKVGPLDELLIYYSGHGHLNKKIGKGYWIPADAERDNTSAYIRNSTIREYIETIPTLHTLLISDSCFSGSLFVRGASRSTATIRQLAAIPSRWAFCSGRHDEEVFDGEPGANSPFAESIMDTLRRNQDKQINVARLIDRVVEQTRSNYNQLPEGNPLFGVGHKGGQYIFNRRADEREDWAKAKAGGTLAAYRQFLVNHPNGKHADEARENIAFLEEETAWEKAKASNTILAYYEYDQAYPKGRYSRHALDAITELEEEAAWRKAERRDMLSDYRRYTANYPKGKYRAEADARISAIISGEQEPALWKQTTLRNTPEAYAAYLKQYPEGAYAREARDRQSELERAAAGKQEAEQKQQKAEQKLEKEEAAWKAAQAADTEAAYRNFYLSHPRGRFAEEAKMAMKKFQEAAVDPAPGQEVKKPELAGVSRAAAPLPSEPEGENPLRKWLPIALGGVGGLLALIWLVTMFTGNDPPEISHQFNGDVLEVAIAKGDPPYQFKLIKDGQEKYSRELSRAGKHNLSTNGLEYAGQYIMEVVDGAGKSVSKEITINFLDTSKVDPSPPDPDTTQDPLPDVLKALEENMASISGGTFTMGCPTEQTGCQGEETPAHGVTLSSFKISKYEVTQEQWRAVMGDNPSSFKGCDKCPVEQVSWNDIQKFIKKLNTLTGQQYRLPTEAEWEYAARGGQNLKYAGSQDNIESVAWYKSNSEAKTHPVGMKNPNGYGLFDMTGNVWEWCNDWKSDYSHEAQTNPTGPAKGSFRVVRGGSYYDGTQDCRVLYRSYNGRPDDHYSSLGFRLALDKLKYKTITLNGKTWLAENLNLKVRNSWCYDDQDENCHKYGRLYNWQAAQEACKKLGPGWRLPTDAEWSELMVKYGGEIEAYKALAKEESTGFDALLVGYRKSDGNYYDLRVNGYSWSGTAEKGTQNAWGYEFRSAHSKLYRSSYDKSFAFSCRCVKD